MQPNRQQHDIETALKHSLGDAGKPQVLPELPNMQINIATYTSEGPSYNRFELLAAAITGVLLQGGLIIIAGATSFYPHIRAALGASIEPYGFPCYAAGSLLLSMGIAVCSLAIEQSTEEHELSKTAETASPRLIFLQKKQRVQVSTTVP